MDDGKPTAEVEGILTSSSVSHDSPGRMKMSENDYKIELALIGIDYRSVNLICLTYALQNILIEEYHGKAQTDCDLKECEEAARVLTGVESQRIRDLADGWVLKLRGEAVSRMRKWGTGAAS